MDAAGSTIDAMGWAWTLIGVGLLSLALGGELVVRGAVGAAQSLGVSPLIIGVVLMGFGTSMPEMVTSVQSVLAGAPDIAVGNVVGSNIANLLLIAGVAAALSGISSAPRLLSRDAPALAIATLVLAGLLLADALTPLAGIAMAVALALYLRLAIQGESAAVGEPEAVPMPEADGPSLPTAFLFFGLGLVATLLGAQWLVDGSADLARRAGLSEAFIGASIVAVGTSLPELAATVAAAIRGRADLAIGNVFGSNIFNSLAIMAAATWATPFGAPLTLPPSTAAFDLWAMLAATAIVILFVWTGRRLARWEGLVLLALYVGFLTTAFLVSAQ